MNQICRTLARSIARLVPTHTTLRVRRGPLKGMKWIAGAAPGQGKGLATVFNQAEPEQLAAAWSLIPAGGICFDVGANVGLYTLLMARRARRVVAFEPLPRNLRYLWSHVQINRLENVSILPSAVSDRPCLTGFDAGDDPGRGSLDDAAGQMVTTVTLDDVARRLGTAPDLVKIDVEGAELAVLRGAMEILRTKRPTLLLSTHGPAIRQQCLDLLSLMGYEPAQPLNAPSRQAASEFVVLPRVGTALIVGRAA
jgi:FkbM family methyltransferase